MGGERIEREREAMDKTDRLTAAQRRRRLTVPNRRRGQCMDEWVIGRQGGREGTYSRIPPDTSKFDPIYNI